MDRAASTSVGFVDAMLKLTEKNAEGSALNHSWRRFDELRRRRLMLARVHRRAKQHGTDTMSVKAPGVDVSHVQGDTLQSLRAQGIRQVFGDQPGLAVGRGVEHRNVAHLEISGQARAEASTSESAIEMPPCRSRARRTPSAGDAEDFSVA